ncbi:MAG: Ig-like domain-containing protein [Gammaproteobacteria bacterium]
MLSNFAPSRFVLLILATSLTGCGFVDSAGDNSAPDISAADIQANEDEMVTLTSTVTDDFENITKYQWVQTEGTPTVALQSADAPTATFVAPNLVQNAILRFRITVTDNFDATSSADVSVGIAADNDPPVVTGESATVAEGQTITVDILSNDADPDEPGKTLTAAVETGPAQGTATVDGGALVYAHNGSQPAGDDAITYRVSDGAGLSVPATVTISITAVDDPPTALGDAYAVNEGAVLGVVDPAAGLLGNDVDEEGALLTASMGQPPTNGSVALNPNGSFTYTHNGNESAPPNLVVQDSFTYNVSDGAQIATGRVTLDVQPVNDPPVAVNDAYQVAVGGPLVVAAAQGVLVNDADPDSVLTAQFLTLPPAGTGLLQAFGPDGSFTYLAPNPILGVQSTSFTYRATDGVLASDATVTITIADVVAQQAGVCAVTTQEAVVSGTLDAGIVGAGPLTYALARAPDPRQGAVAVMANGDFVFTPAPPQAGDPGLRGAATFDYTASGSVSVRRTQTVVIKPNVMSITGIAPDGVGYRQSLADSLANGNYQADFVGSQSTDGLADPEHEESVSLTDGQAASSVYAWLSANPSDVVLLNVGTHGLNDASDPNATAAADVRTALDEIDRWEADNNVPVTVMLALIIDQVDAATSTTNPNVAVFNSDLQALANERINAGDRLIVVDQHDALTYPDDLAADTTTPWKRYPDAAGYAKMADRWFEALDAAGVLPKCP